MISPPVTAPLRTLSSATDAQSYFAQSGQEFGISGAGVGLTSSSDAYSAIYRAAAVGTSSTVDTAVSAQQALTGASATVSLDGLSVADGATTPPAATSYEAESPTNALAGQVRISTCTACSGGKTIGFIGKNGVLTFS